MTWNLDIKSFILTFCFLLKALNSVLLLRVVLKQVVGDVLNGILGAFLGALAHGGEENGDDGLVEVGADG